MRRADRLALFIVTLAIGLSALVTARIYEAVPHLEDEIAYVWQATLYADGQLSMPTPPQKASFLVPFVVDYEGQRFGKYPLGWPVLLSLGVRLGLRSWINPLLAGLAVWLVYRLGKKVFGETVGILGAGLLAVSPFFLLNTGSLLSHAFGLVLATAFALFWLDIFAYRQDDQPSGKMWFKVFTLGLTLGVLVLSRPYSALGVALPFAIHGIYLLWRGNALVRQQLFAFAATVLLVSSLHFLWQYAVTGDPLLNPYTLWWEYDKVGFGPGVGRTESGHTLRLGWLNTRFSLRSGYSDLFGWGTFSWVFLPFGLLGLRRNWRGWMVAGIFPALLLVYLAYWVGSWLFGPRYYYEGLQSLALVSAVGIAWLAGWPVLPGQAFPRFSGMKRFRPLAVSAILGVLVALNLVYYLPLRLGMMHDLYGISRADLAPFQTQEAAGLTPALVIVHTPRWMPYGALLEMASPDLSSPFIFAIGIGPKTDAALEAEFPERRILHYYPEEPWKFYTGRRTP
jgi:4-amino-4-deoxy-L-arabinose transferase-like glycosyltransferase